MTLLPFQLAAVPPISMAAAWLLGQAHLSDSTTVTVGLVLTAVTAAFWLGSALTGLRKDIRNLQEQIAELPCNRDNCNQHQGPRKR